MRPHRAAVVMQQLREWAEPADRAVRALGVVSNSAAMLAPNAALRVLEYVESLECDLTTERLRIKRIAATLEPGART